MTTPELEPEHAEMLLRLAESKSSIPLAPIDVAAGAFVDELRERHNVGDLSWELTADATQFMTRLVGWSSKNIDAETGRVPVVSLDKSVELNRQLDGIGLEFLRNDDYAIYGGRTIAEDGTQIIDTFDFLQSRNNGSVQLVTVYRHEAVKHTKSNSIEYSLAFNEVGYHDPRSESRLDVARMVLENIGTSALSLASAGVELPAKGMRVAGVVVRQLGRSSPSE